MTEEQPDTQNRWGRTQYGYTRHILRPDSPGVSYCRRNVSSAGVELAQAPVCERCGQLAEQDRRL